MLWGCCCIGIVVVDFALVLLRCCWMLRCRCCCLLSYFHSTAERVKQSPHRGESSLHNARRRGKKGQKGGERGREGTRESRGYGTPSTTKRRSEREREGRRRGERGKGTGVIGGRQREKGKRVGRGLQGTDRFGRHGDVVSPAATGGQ